MRDAADTLREVFPDFPDTFKGIPGALRRFEGPDKSYLAELARDSQLSTTKLTVGRYDISIVLTNAINPGEAQLRDPETGDIKACVRCEDTVSPSLTLILGA